jgi:hypothetical protein
MSQTANTDPQGQIEGSLLRAVQASLTANHGSHLVRMRTPYALISVPGLSKSQVRGHLLACLLTLGLWVPVFGVIAILRTPKLLLLVASQDDGVWTWELDHDGLPTHQAGQDPGYPENL